MRTEPDKSAAAVKTLGRQLGFDRVGITSADPLAEAGQRLSQAVAKGWTADMTYLQRNPHTRCDPRAFKPWARAVISVGVSYHFIPLGPTAAGRAPLISRYALGRDYHLVLAEKLTALAQQVGEMLGREFRHQVSVDTSPLMEKPLAQRAGVGWQGKNTLIINETYGSWIFLGELITDLELTPDAPAENRCDSCRACIEACPTKALSEPGVLDARKCLSYLTVEHQGEFSPEALQLLSRAGRERPVCVFGCDICQEVCPFNRDRTRTKENQFEPGKQLLNLTLDQARQISKSEFEEMFLHTAAGRLSYGGFRRNVRVAACVQP